MVAGAYISSSNGRMLLFISPCTVLPFADLRYHVEIHIDATVMSQSKQTDHIRFVSEVLNLSAKNGFRQRDLVEGEIRRNLVPPFAMRKSIVVASKSVKPNDSRLDSQDHDIGLMYFD